MTKRPGQDDLLEKVVERTGMAPNVTAPVLDAFLAEIHQSFR